MADHEALLSTLSVVGLIWYIAQWSIGILGCWTARKRYRLRPRSPVATAPRESVPGVSILRPLKGLDPNLYENLESTFTQEYPNYEIIFSVAEDNDQSLSVVRDLISKYPDVDAKVIIGEEVVGVNPKVNNLVRSYRQAANDILWVLDSNVMVVPGTLARSVDALVGPTPLVSFSTPMRVGLVHHVPFALSNVSDIGSRLEEAFLNTNHAKMYLAINALAIESCVVGKSNLYRRSDLDRVDGSSNPTVPGPNIASQPGNLGLQTFGKFLAEDNTIASALWHRLGLRHDMSCDVAYNVVGSMSFSDYVWRRVRWIRVRKHMVLIATVLEPFTEAVVLSGIASASLKYLIGVPAWIFIILHFSLWLLVDLDVRASLAGHSSSPGARWDFILAWLARELLALPIWFLAILGDEIVWRGRKYKVLRNGEARPSGESWLVAWFSRCRWKNTEHYEAIGS